MHPDLPDSVPTALAKHGGIEVLSRLGYVVHGAIYILIGGLAAKLAWGSRGQLADPPSAIGYVAQRPEGGLLVPLIAAGLAAYSLWRFIQAVADPDCQGRSAKGLVVRFGRVISGIGYSLLALFAIRVAFGGVEQGQQSNSWATQVLAEPLGALAGGFLALILLGVASDDIRKACTADFGERLKHRQMGLAGSLTSKYAGRWGFAARAVILSSGAVYLLRAVFTHEPEQARGFTGILAGLLGLPYGDWILGFVALGLAAYGVFMVQAGIFRRHPF